MIMKYSPQQTTIKVWSSTLKKLRLLRNLTGISMVAILDRLVSVELAAVSKGDEWLARKSDPASFLRQSSQLSEETQILEKEK